MRRILFLLVAAFLSIGLAACGDDDSTGPGTDTDLSDQELEALAEVLFTQGFAVTATSGPRSEVFDPDLRRAAGVPIGPIDFGPQDVACELGGVVTVTGTVSGNLDQQGAGTLNYSFTQVHKSCMAQAEGGMQFTLDGNPDTTMDISMDTSANGAFSLSGTYTGGIAWQTGDRNGTCSVNLSFDATGNLETGATSSGSVTGSMCGRSVTEDIT
jgi:hypothetical protein